MKKPKTTYFNRIVPILLLCTCLTANAQKLTNIQNTSLRAPVNAKADGKADEWNNTFQAHNASADVLYTIANDDENLYLVVQAKDVNVINTIVGYGFEFEIQKSGKKDDKDKISITYPVIPKKGGGLTFGGKSGLLADTSNGAANAVMNRNNLILEQKLKSIIVTGIKGLDTLSVYNEDGIKAAGRFDTHEVYTFEISIALKYIGLPVDGVSKFAWHMIVNGYVPPENLSRGTMPMLMADGSVQLIDSNSPLGEQLATGANIKFLQRYPHTDFWGEYTLAKK